MTLINSAQAYGHVVNLQATHPSHLTRNQPVSDGASSFDQLLMQALNGTNDLQLEAERLSQEMIINPDSVDTHDVTIALAQANLAVSLTKAVVDGALEAYTNIINMR